MRKFIILAALILGSHSAAIAQKTPVGEIYDARILRVSDGDTVVVEALWIIPPMKKEIAVRVYGVDTPEKGFRGQCESEKQRGEQASEFTKLVIKSTKKHQVILYGWEKYGGRVLGDMILDGMSLRALLIKNGFAREYYGDAKQSWCN